jgi:hypothetical protein
MKFSISTQGFSKLTDARRWSYRSLCQEYISATIENRIAALKNHFVTLRSRIATLKNGSVTGKNHIATLRNRIATQINGIVTPGSHIATVENYIVTGQNHFVTRENRSAAFTCDYTMLTCHSGVSPDHLSLNLFNFF